MNKVNNEQNLVRSKSNLKTYLIYAFMTIALLAIGGGLYYAIFTPEYISSSASRPRTFTPDPVDQYNTNTSINSNNYNTSSPSSNNPVAPSQNTLQAERPWENNQANNATQTRNAQTNETQADENSLPVSNMQDEKALNGSTLESNKNKKDSSDFEISPPVNEKGTHAGTEIIIPSDAELKAKTDAAAATQLERLQKAKEEQIKLAENEKRILPSTKNQVSLSENTIQKTDQDPVITDGFIHNLAQILVTNYVSAQKNNTSPTLTATKLNQRFGVTMKGLVHSKGRAGIFEYAYHPKMIPLLANFIEPRLMSEMQKQVSIMGLSVEEEQEMYHSYAKDFARTATTLEAIVNTKDLEKNIRAYLKIEQKLLTTKQEFANTLIEFEMAKQAQESTNRLESQLTKISKEANSIEQKLTRSQGEIISRILKTNSALSQKELMSLALWVNRRQNKEATLVAIQTLRNFSSSFSSK